MSYHFVFREIIYNRDMHDPYKVPDYLMCDEEKHNGFYVAYKFFSKEYGTIDETMSDYNAVLNDSELSSSPQFFNNHMFMGNGPELFKNYIRHRDGNE